MCRRISDGRLPIYMHAIQHSLQTLVGTFMCLCTSAAEAKQQRGRTNVPEQWVCRADVCSDSPFFALVSLCTMASPNSTFCSWCLCSIFIVSGWLELVLQILWFFLLVAKQPVRNITIKWSSIDAEPYALILNKTSARMKRRSFDLKVSPGNASDESLQIQLNFTDRFESFLTGQIGFSCAIVKWNIKDSSWDFFLNRW